MRTLRKCKIDFNKSLVLTINNLLKPLLSKPETKLIQRKYETILIKDSLEAMTRPFQIFHERFLEATTHTWSHTEPHMFRQKLIFSFWDGKTLTMYKLKCESNWNVVTPYCLRYRGKKMIGIIWKIALPARNFKETMIFQ